MDIEKTKLANGHAMKYSGKRITGSKCTNKKLHTVGQLIGKGANCSCGAVAAAKIEFN